METLIHSASPLAARNAVRAQGGTPFGLPSTLSYRSTAVTYETIKPYLRRGAALGNEPVPSSVANSRSIVIGEGMQSVKDAARGLQGQGVNAKWYQAWSKNFPKNRPMTAAELEAALQRNERWIRSKIDGGYSIYDIGVDPTRSVRSPFYELEQQIIMEMNFQTISLPRSN